MRQFVFGLVAAAVLFWVYSVWSSHGREANASGASGADAGGLDRLIADGALQQAPSAVADKGAPAQATPAKPLDAGSAGDDAPVCEKARAALQQGDQADSGRVWEALAMGQLPQALRQRLGKVAGEVVQALKPEDAERALAMLGPSNAFLRSVEGRQAARRALELCGQQPDESSVRLSTRLIEACMRGPITKADQDAHAFVDLAYGEHKKRVERWVCDPTNLARARNYQVKRGDTLAAIANRFQAEKLMVEEGTLAVLNRIHNPNALQAGQQIKVPVDPIRTVVDKRSFLMAVYVGETILRLYWVGLGVNDKTPVAEFTVLDKIRNPDWFSPKGQIAFGDPKNILGKFFVKFLHDSYQGFGAHGTPMPETVGTQASDGCIRMYDADIEDYFKLVPRKSKVEIRAS